MVCASYKQVTDVSFEEPAKKNLLRAATACRRYGWISFWLQLTLSIVSAIILLFSVAFTSQVTRCHLHPIKPAAPQDRGACSVHYLSHALLLGMR